MVVWGAQECQGVTFLDCLFVAPVWVIVFQYIIKGVCETEESGQVCEATMPNPTPENMAKPLPGAH